MFSFLRKLFELFKKTEIKDKEINSVYSKLKELYNYDAIPVERKQELARLIEKNGYLPYSYIQAIEELTDAEVLYGLEMKWAANSVFSNGEFSFENENISPVKRAGFESAEWIQKEQHDIKLINLAGLGNGNVTHEPGKLIDWLRQLLVLPVGRPDKKVLNTTLYLIPFHPREFGCAYLPTSLDISPNLEDKTIKEKIGLDAKEQVQLFVSLAQLAGHPVIYDVLPQTGRFSKMVLANPWIARWYDINALMKSIENGVDAVSDKLKADNEFDADDVEIVADLYKSTLKNGSSDLSEHYRNIYERFDEELLPLKKEISNKMLVREEQIKLHKRVKDVVAKKLGVKPSKSLKEPDITKQGEIIRALIASGLWPAPGGAWCSAGIPIFDKMSEHGDYPVFRHYDCNGKDVTDFANLDCQTPFYFVFLENGKYNAPVIDAFIDYLKELQKDYNFDGFRVDHIDHVVDSVSQKDCVPISYRAPAYVLGKANRVLKSKTPYFAALAEYMLWDKFYKEYHEDMCFDILWGNDIISQSSKNPQEIMNNNRELAEYNEKSAVKEPLSILKTYNNQDGEFRSIDQYPGQLGEEGALFKWFKFKFLPGGKNANRPVMYIDGDESFTKTGIEGAIGAEISMPRARNDEFFKKFNAIDRFALNCELTREGEAQIITQEDGFAAWMVSKDPLKEALLIIANYEAPTEKISEEGEDGLCYTYVKDGKTVYNREIAIPGDFSIVAEYKYNPAQGEFEEIPFAKPENSMHFGELKCSEFKIYKMKK